MKSAIENLFLLLIFVVAMFVTVLVLRKKPIEPDVPKTIQAVEVRPMGNFSGGAGKYLVECEGGCRAIVLTNTTCREVKVVNGLVTTVTPKLKVVHGDFSDQTVLYSTPSANGQWVIAEESIPYDVKSAYRGESGSYTCTARADFTIFFGEKGGVITTYP